MRHTSISSLLAAQARLNPDAFAILAPRRAPLTYGRLYGHVRETVELLVGAGINVNDRVALVAPNGPELAVSFLAVAACATCAPLNPEYSASEFDYYLQDLNAKALIVQSGINSTAAVCAKALGIEVIELMPTVNQEAGIFELEPGSNRRGASTSLAGGDDIALIIHTSGTTSLPKIVPLTQNNILASAENTSRTLALTSSDRTLNVMPLFHTHGLIGAILSSLLAGASAVCTPGFHAPQFFEWVKEFRPTWYTAAPSIHQAILARAAANRSVILESPLRFIRACSSPLPPRLMLDLERVFDVPVLEAYAMTESMQIASNPLPPSKRKPGTVGIAQGQEVGIIDQQGNFVPRGQSGEIVIRGENVFRGYEKNSSANSSSFINGWFKTGDLGVLDEDGYLSISGRIKESINRGGQKVSPREVEEVLLDHPSVDEAACFRVPHVELGEDVAAAVVLKEDASATEWEIREFAASRLAFYKVPRQIVFLKEIPKSHSGKFQRNNMAEKLGLTGQAETRTAPKPDFTPPQTPLENSLSKIWAEVLGIEQVGLHDDFMASGGDSLLATQIISRVRDSLHVEVSLLNFFDVPTVAGMASVVTKRQAERLERDEMLSLLSELEGLSDDEALRRIEAAVSDEFAQQVSH